eukprot:2147888-Pleurochrysis_carterae.AAC.1
MRVDPGTTTSLYGYCKIALTPFPPLPYVQIQLTPQMLFTHTRERLPAAHAKTMPCPVFQSPQSCDWSTPPRYPSTRSHNGLPRSPTISHAPFAKFSCPHVKLAAARLLIVHEEGLRQPLHRLVLMQLDRLAEAKVEQRRALVQPTRREDA